jgi:hypothetical protein
MNLNDLINSPGYIFGPAMLLSGLIALVICLRATRHGQTFRPRRIVIWSVAPLALGIVGALVGCIVWSLQKDPVPHDAAVRGVMALGYTILFGLIVSSVPLIWTGFLMRRRSRAQGC